MAAGFISIEPLLAAAPFDEAAAVGTPAGTDDGSGCCPAVEPTGVPPRLEAAIGVGAVLVSTVRVVLPPQARMKAESASRAGSCRNRLVTGDIWWGLYVVPLVMRNFSLFSFYSG